MAKRRGTPPPGAETNREHYHVWVNSRGLLFGRVPFQYRQARAFHTQPAAYQFARRRYDRDRFEVKPCWCAACAPKLE